MNEALADGSVQEVISSNLALNLVMGADWMFRQMFSFHDVLKLKNKSRPTTVGVETGAASVVVETGVDTAPLSRSRHHSTTETTNGN